MDHLGPEHPPVPVDGGLEVVDGDRHVVDLGEEAHGTAPPRNGRTRSSPIRSRSSGSSTPRPSVGARHSTPSLPTWRLAHISPAACPVRSRAYTAERVG